MEGAFPGDEVRTAVSNIEVNGNPFGLGFAARGEWADGTGVATLESGEEADILYFVGCYASFDKRNQQVAKSFIAICNAAGVRVGILGKEEKCCGEPLRKLGNEYLYQMVAAENIERIKRLRRQADRHHLPALFQYPGPRLQGPGAGYAGGTLQHLRQPADRRRASEAQTAAV